MKNKAYKYENLQIGNFLISVGYYLRDFNFSFPASLNLYQQTPEDYTIGDLFGALAGKYFIIEFKNDKNSLKDDLKKPQRSKLKSFLANERRDLIAASIKGHYVCYPSFEGQEMDYNLNPYVTIDDERFIKYNIIGVQQFLNKLITDESIGCSYEEISKYINLMQDCSKKANSATSSASGGRSVSGIFLNFNKEEGIRFILFDDLNFLQQRILLEKEIIQELTINLQRNIKRDRGIGM